MDADKFIPPIITNRKNQIGITTAEGGAIAGGVVALLLGIALWSFAGYGVYKYATRRRRKRSR